MMTGDYLTYDIKSRQSGGSAWCRCCSLQAPETLTHIIVLCDSYTEIRSRFKSEYEELSRISDFDLEQIFKSDEEYCQFILDPTSMNLKSRISYNDTNIDDWFKLSRDFCYSVNARRLSLLKEMSLTKL